MTSTLNNITKASYHPAMAPVLKAGPRRRPPSHPGEILAGVIKDHKLGLREAARAIGVNPMTLSNVLEKKSAMTPAMALRVGKWVGNGAGIWLGLQADYDIHHAALELAQELAAIEPLPQD
jgi:addiction module HigA family antidote